MRDEDLMRRSGMQCLAEGVKTQKTEISRSHAEKIDLLYNVAINWVTKDGKTRVRP